MTPLCLLLWFLYFLAAYGVMFVALLLKEYNGIKTFCTPSKNRCDCQYGKNTFSDDELKEFYKCNLRAMFLFAPITTPLFLIWLVLWGTCTVMGYFSTIADWADPSKFELTKSATQEELETLRAELKTLREGKQCGK